MNLETNKWINALAYVVFFVPLMMDGNNETYKFHANQGLNLLLFSLIVVALGSMIPIIGWFIVLPLGGIFCFALLIIGILNSLNDKSKELPLIGKYTLIK